MTDLGFIWLSLTLAATTYSVFAFALGISQKDDRLLATGRKSVYAATALLSLAVLTLVYALYARDFQVEYVASHTSRDLPLPYTLSALWAGQQGSLLFCTWLLSVFASAVLLLHRRRQEPLSRYTSLVIAITEGFFLVLLIFVTNPFVQMGFMPADGLGMNPLLQSPAMLWHPPLLYLGYVGFTVPFALTMGALISGHLKDPYLPRVRRWGLLAWLCLGLGTLIGAQWAYVKPGWGSYWAWNAAESTSLMAWLMGTALVHSLMIQDQRRTMKLWNMALVILTFALCIFGALTTSSSIVSSVHALTVSRIGSYSLVFLGFVLVGSTLLLLRRLPELRAEGEWGDPISRQSSLLLAILLLVVATLAILLGTLFPLVSEAWVAPNSDFFNWSIALTLGPLILLMGVCPFIRWRGSTVRSLRRDLLIPFFSALVVAVSLLLLGLRHSLAILAFSICAFVAVGTLLHFYRGLCDRRQTSQENYLSAFVSMMRRQQRRYGGYIVHLGIVLIVIGVIGSSAYRVEEEARLKPGASLTVADYSLRYDDFAFYPTQGKDVAAATLSIFQGEGQVDLLVPERHFHHRAQQFVSEVAIRTTLKDDLYVALIDWEGADPTIVLRVIISPLMVWMWVGGAILLLGTVIAIWPSRHKEDLEERMEEEIMRVRQVGGETSRGEATP
jgi:cytochrome c-type biogenesis protein CcmF